MRVFVTGIGGLIGSTVAEEAHKRGFRVWGIDNDSRGHWFGSAGSVAWRIEELQDLGILVIEGNFRNRVRLVEHADLIVHCASQPSHDFSRSHVIEDSMTNYIGTVELLEATRELAPKAVFAFLSTNKVYGDRINEFEYRVAGDRFVMEDSSFKHGVDEDFAMDDSLHTPFGVSKLAADMMVQEYRHCFGMKTVSFRCGCLTGKSGTAVELQGFLGYLVKCAVEGKPYTIYGHQGYQVRDNIDAADVADAIFRYAAEPKASVYNMGGGVENAVSINEVIMYLRSEYGFNFEVIHGPKRVGDHRWYISDTGLFEAHYPDWRRKGVWEIVDEMVDAERRKNK